MRGATMPRAKQAKVFDSLAVVGKAFASAKRLELIGLLTQGERTVDSLATEVGAGMSTVSAHLQVLKLSSLVRTRKQGTKVYYRLAGDEVADLYLNLRVVATQYSAEVDHALAAYLQVGGQGDVEEVTREQLMERMSAHEVTLLDVRSPEEFGAGHIPGARSVPFAEIENLLADLPQDRDVVAYCRGAHCVMASDAVVLLHSTGVSAHRLQDGMLEWRLAGLPVETAAE